MFCARYLLAVLLIILCADFISAVPADPTTALLRVEPTLEQSTTGAAVPAPTFFDNYVPPLGNKGSIALLRSAATILELHQDQLAFYASGLQNMLDDIVAYTRYYDNLHSGLTDYRWEYIGRDAKEFRLERAIRNVNAIRLEAEVLPDFDTLSLESEDGERKTYDSDLLVRLEDPGRIIFFLEHQTAIRSFSFSTAGEAEQRFQGRIFLGTAPYPEYGKQALYYLKQCYDAVEAGEIERTIEKLRSATRALIDYHHFQRSTRGSIRF